MHTEPTPLTTSLRSGEQDGSRSNEDDGVPDAFHHELLLRQFARMGELHLYEITKRLGLQRSKVEVLLSHLRMLHLIEVPRRGDFEGDVTYTLTQTGQLQSKLAFEKCQYVGPAPVTLNDYTESVRDQSTRIQPITAGRLKDALGNLVISEALLPILGSALNSGKAVYFYGPSGSGKTYLAEHLIKTLLGTIWMPYAIYVDGEVIQVYDPKIHHAAENTQLSLRGLSHDDGPDRRWICVERPVVITGGELTLEMLELEYDTLTHLYAAPPQVKANNGILVVDDLGRQLISPRQLLNRWIVPLDRRVDYLSLHTGGKVQMPFDVKVIFLSNLTPDELIDSAFSRRMGYKILIGEISRSAYLKVSAQACENLGVAYETKSIDYMVYQLHSAYQQVYLPCIPYDVISKIRDRALYLEEKPQLTPELIHWAWRLYFGVDSESKKQVVQSHETEEVSK